MSLSFSNRSGQQQSSQKAWLETHVSINELEEEQICDMSGSSSEVLASTQKTTFAPPLSTESTPITKGLALPTVQGKPPKVIRIIEPTNNQSTLAKPDEIQGRCKADPITKCLFYARYLRDSS